MSRHDAGCHPHTTCDGATRHDVLPHEEIEIVMDHRHIQLLQKLQTAKSALDPVPNVISPFGYHVPDACETFALDIGQELPELNHMSEQGLLERDPADKIHLCPYCRHFGLNFREVCPQCQNHFIAEMDMIHHYSCGYVSFESEYMQNDQFVCPKCRKTLKHLGVDYERSATNFRCHACTHIFPEPETGCLCLSCGQAFLIERAVIEQIFSYRLSARGSHIAIQGHFDGWDGHGVSAEQAGSPLSEWHTFESELSRELDRASVHGRLFSLAMVQPKDIEAYEMLMGPDATDMFIQDLVSQTNTALRKCDFAALYKDRFLAVLLPETPASATAPVMTDVETALQRYCSEELSSEIILHTGIVEYEPGIDSSDQMLLRAEEAVEQAKQALQPQELAR